MRNKNIAATLLSALSLAATAALAAPTPSFPVPPLDAGFRVDWFDSSVSPHSLADADALINGSGPVIGTATQYLSTINLTDASVPFASDMFAVHITGYVTLAAGSYTFFGTHDDGMRLTVGGDDVVVFDSDTSTTTTQSALMTLGAGTYSIDAVVWEQGGVFDFQIGYLGVQGAPVLFEGQHATSVPEPQSLALVGMGLLGLCAARRRRG